MSQEFRFARVDLIPDVLVVLLALSGFVLFDRLVFDARARDLCTAALALSTASVWIRARRPLRRVGDRASGAVFRANPFRLWLRRSLVFTPILVVFSGLVASAWPVLQPIREAAEPRKELDLSGISKTSQDCLSAHEATKYLASLHERLQASWTTLPPSSHAGFVALGFILDRSGETRFVRVIDESSSEYRALGRLALERSAPFEPLTGALRCLTKVELRARFEGDSSS